MILQIFAIIPKINARGHYKNYFFNTKIKSAHINMTLAINQNYEVYGQKQLLFENIGLCHRIYI
jgi:hypothetical protein